MFFQVLFAVNLSTVPVDAVREGTTIICLANPTKNQDTVDALKARKVSAALARRSNASWG